MLVVPVTVTVEEDYEIAGFFNVFYWKDLCGYTPGALLPADAPFHTAVFLLVLMEKISQMRPVKLKNCSGNQK